MKHFLLIPLFAALLWGCDGAKKEADAPVVSKGHEATPLVGSQAPTPPPAAPMSPEIAAYNTNMQAVTKEGEAANAKLAEANASLAKIPDQTEKRKALSAAYDVYIKAIDRTADHFHAIRAPKALRPVHKKIVDGYHRLARLTAGVNAAVRSGDQAQIQSALASLQSFGETFQKNIQSMSEALKGHGVK